MADAAYREAKERFYQGHSGGTSLEVVGLTSLAPVSILLVQVVGIALPGSAGWSGGSAASGVLSTLCVTVPMYVSFTAPEWAWALAGSQLLATAAVLWAAGAKARPTREAMASVAEALNRPHKPFMATYRGMMMLATCIAILAVDFRNFPRRLAKTETYGVSLMDAGVGSVLRLAASRSAHLAVSQAMVSPLARKPSSAVSQRLLASLLSSSPLIAIGGVRLLGTRAAQYHEHASEYGVHWNFFFTLAAISTLCNCVPLTGWKAALGAGALSVSYEVVLQTTGLSDYVLAAPRVDLFSANREGVLGCIGYCSVFYAGVAVGGSIFASQRSGREWLGYAAKLGIASACLWTCSAIMMASGMQTSRRLVNLPYVTWTLAHNTFTLAEFLLLEITLHFIIGHGQDSGGVSLWRARIGRQSEILSDAINRNQLFIFLISNLLTGLVNMTLPTLNAPDWMASTTVLAYSLTVSSVAMALDAFGVTLKFW